MLTNFYIDGFNLYYRALQGTPYKWLNLRKLAEALFPLDTIHKVCYFTALITPRPNDLTQPQRQQGIPEGTRDPAGHRNPLRHFPCPYQVPPASDIGARAPFVR